MTPPEPWSVQKTTQLGIIHFRKTIPTQPTGADSAKGCIIIVYENILPGAQYHQQVNNKYLTLVAIAKLLVNTKARVTFLSIYQNPTGANNAMVVTPHAYQSTLPGAQYHQQVNNKYLTLVAIAKLLVNTKARVTFLSIYQNPTGANNAKGCIIIVYENILPGAQYHQQVNNKYLM
jgi:hypothetical protein